MLRHLEHRLPAAGRGHHQQLSVRLPFVTLVVGYLLLDEQITVMSVIGAVLITVGVIVALKKPKETA